MIRHQFLPPSFSPQIYNPHSDCPSLSWVCAGMGNFKYRYSDGGKFTKNYVPRFAPLALFDIASGTSFATKDTQNLLCLPTGLTLCAGEPVSKWEGKGSCLIKYLPFNAIKIQFSSLHTYRIGYKYLILADCAE